MALLQFHYSGRKERSVESRQEAKDFGVLGEQMATRYLEDHGFVILDRNYRKGHQEVDIITLDQGELVVVEVKTRSSGTYLAPEEAVDHKKRLNIIKVADNYVLKHHRTEPVRFDIISIISNDKGTEIRHLKNAYNVMSF